MKQLKFYLFLISGVLFFSSFANPNFNGKDKNSKKEHEKVTVLVKWFLPEVLKEVSGMCWLDEQRIACIQDESGVIYIYNISTATIETQIPFADPGDFESITKAGDTYFVMRSDGRIFEITNTASKNPLVKQYDIPFDRTLDFEGFFYDKTKKRLLITFKQPDPQAGTKTRGIYSFDPVKKTMSNKPVYEIDLSSQLLNKKDDDNKDKDLYKNFFPSDIAINPVTSDIYITDGINCSLLVIDKSGKMKSYFKLDKDDFPQPEGITFSPKGDLFLSSEGVKQSGIIARVIIETELEKDKKKKD